MLVLVALAVSVSASKFTISFYSTLSFMIMIHMYTCSLFPSSQTNTTNGAANRKS